MPDPARKQDDDDVLSSIRRLVAGPPSNKLVLTEAQRVDAEDAALTESLEARIAELEAAVSLQRDEFEPDGSEQLDAETPDAIAHLPGAAPTDPAGDGPALLEQAALEELVARVVRAELQGALGERVTRSLRKMVRQEVQRALALRQD